jgi:hypothetical protein
VKVKGVSVLNYLPCYEDVCVSGDVSPSIGTSWR